MRFIKTFVIHLYVDLEADDLLCGDLKALPDQEVHVFKNPPELIRLLQSFRQVSQTRGPAADLSNPTGDKRG